MIHDLKPYPLVVQVEGRFKTPFEGKPRPAWAPKLEFSPDGRPMPGQVHRGMLNRRARGDDRG